MPKKPKTIFPIKIFVNQIAKILQENNIKREEFHRRLGIKNTARWGKTVMSVEMDTVQLICETFNKSLDWLVFGKEPVTSFSEALPDYYESRPLPPLDENLLLLVLEAVDQYLQAKRKKLLPFDKNSLICELYKHCLESKERPSLFLVERYLVLCLKFPK